MLVVVVGRSGAGKSSFIEAMGLAEYHCVLSKPMLEELRRRGLSVDHDQIHVLAQEWYAVNRWWQIEYVLSELGGKAFLILDGLRYAFELERLRELFPGNILVVKIVASPEVRFQRLRERKKVPLSSWEEFQRLEEDESGDMDLELLLAGADIVVENNDSLQQLEKKGRIIAFLLEPLVRQTI